MFQGKECVIQERSVAEEGGGEGMLIKSLNQEAVLFGADASIDQRITNLIFILIFLFFFFFFYFL